ncbi:hypothetical protein [Hymenobacter fodinae]|uniref:Uncharacterized protein n=1 Tax=Hymenobacter fodinae TaxID=2510796 RepID=A0A4Z0P4J6_9BACT|nr:hypothetical protein [Hymenobacter fodinae]TGE06340.1 hypothetical protein EU556_15945 [Hymenobacter fodinae]
MPDRIITLCYRKIIDASSTKPWDQLVFEDTYSEFRLQGQLFNPHQQYHTFGQLLQFAPGAEQLHFLVSAAVRGYLQQLNGVVPDILDNLGRHFLRFTKFQFELINSDLTDKRRHQVAVNFYSEPLVWHDTVGLYLLVSEQQQTTTEVLTSMFQLQPFLTIYSLQPAA